MQQHSSSQRRILDLVEWNKRRFSLDDISVEQATLIAQTVGPRITVTWSDPASRFVELYSKGWVGTIRCGETLAIRVAPRFSIARLFQLLRWTGYSSSPTTSDTAPIDVAPDTDEWLAQRFVNLLQHVVASGLHKKYVRSITRGQVARGRILIPETVRLQARGSIDLAYEEHVLTPDVFENRAVLWTAYVLLSRTTATERTRAAIAELFATMSRWVSLSPLRPRDFDLAIYDSRTERYRDLHGLCRLILEGSTPEHGFGTTEYDAFGIDTSILFQMVVAKALNLLPKYKSKSQHIVKFTDTLEFRMDNTILRANGTEAAVVDAKYKDPLKLETADIQQVVAYATALGSKRAFLVYPTPVGLVEPITVGDVNVAFIALDLSLPVDDAMGQFQGEMLRRIQPDALDRESTTTLSLSA